MEEILKLLVLSLAEYVIPLIVGLVMTFIVMQLRKAREWIVAKVGTETNFLLQQIVRDAVLQAEQNGLTQKIANIGSVKKQDAIDYTLLQLKTLGITWIPVEQLSRMIESAVNQELTQLKSLTEFK